MQSVISLVTGTLRLLLGVAALAFVAAMPVSLDLAAQVLSNLN